MGVRRDVAADLRAHIDRLLEAHEFRTKQRLTARIEAAAARDLASAFTAQGAAFVRATESMRSQFPAATATEAPRLRDWDRLLALALTSSRARFVRILGRLGREGIRLGARRLIATLGLPASLSLRNPRAVAFLRRAGADKVTGIEATTRDGMRRVLTNAIDNGWSYNRTATEIRATFSGFSRARATRIAVTEAAEAYEWGRRSVVADITDRRGFAFEKQWLTAGDNRVDTICADNEAVAWIPAPQNFPSGHDTPPAHPDCRCVTLYQRAGAPTAGLL